MIDPEIPGGNAPRRTRKPAEERRADILRAAAKVFAQHGYRATDVQFIADEAGVGKGTIYRFFPTKESLFLATLNDVMERLTEEVEAVVEAVEDPWAAICQVSRTYFSFFDRHPEAVELFIHERSEFRDRSMPVYFTHGERRRERWLELFRGLGLTEDTYPTPEIAIDLYGDMAFGAIFVNPLLPRRPGLIEWGEHTLRFIARVLNRDVVEPS